MDSRPQSDLRIEKLAALRAAFRLKARLLAEGVAIDATVAAAGAYKPRVEHLYRHDSGSPSASIFPQELRLLRDPDTTGSASVIANVRLNPRSRWTLTFGEDGFALLGDDDERVPVSTIDSPPYYDKQTAQGTPMWQIVQHMGEDLAGVVPYNYCHYFANGTQCRFCEIVQNYTSSRTFPQSLKPIHDQLEVLAEALRPENGVAHVVVTSGNFRTNDETAAVYERIALGLSASPDRHAKFLFGSLMLPEDPSWIDRLKEAGFDGIAFNIEAWDPDRFAVLVPGKAAFGRARFISGLKRAVDAFGRGYVFSNLPFGIQSLTGLQADTYDSAAEIAAGFEADRGLLDLDVVPLHTIYHTTGANEIGEIPIKWQDVEEFFLGYGRIVHEADIIPDSRSGVLFGLGSITNHPYNDALVVARNESAERKVRS